MMKGLLHSCGDLEPQRPSACDSWCPSVPGASGPPASNTRKNLAELASPLRIHLLHPSDAPLQVRAIGDVSIAVVRGGPVTPAIGNVALSRSYSSHATSSVLARKDPPLLAKRDPPPTRRCALTRPENERSRRLTVLRCRACRARRPQWLARSPATRPFSRSR